MKKHTFIFAKITPKAEYYEVSKDAIKEIIPATRKESGCVNFELFEDETNSLYLYEEWINDKALEDHHAMKYTQSVFESYKSWLAITPEIVKLHKLA